MSSLRLLLKTRDGPGLYQFVVNSFSFLPQVDVSYSLSHAMRACLVSVVQ